MREFLAKIGRFFESHVEKVVLVLVSGVCVWLFFTRVIFSPNVVEYDKKKFAPSQIDRYIQDQKAQELRASLANTKAAADKPYKSPLTQPLAADNPIIKDLFDRPLPGGFVKLFDAPLSFIGPVVAPKVAPVRSERAVAAKYRLPLIPEVTDAAATYLRAAAYIPQQEITPQNTYDKVQTEPNDLDLVTVEAKFDTAELYRRFFASFAGVDVLKEEWRDPCLADPVFAAVQLQRQRRQEDGTWSPWQEVPRSRVEPHGKLFQVVEKMDGLPPGGLDVRILQYKEKMVRMELLQPESYQIASADDDWFPPSFYDKYKSLQKRVEAEERRDQREQQQQQNDRTGDTRGGRAGTYGTQGGRQPIGGMARTGRGTTADGMYGTQQRGGRGSRTTTGRMDPSLDPLGRGTGRPSRRGAEDQAYGYGDMYGMPGAGPGGQRKLSTDEAYWDFSQIMLNYTTDLSKLEKPLLVWAFDDTAQPGESYRYRVRVGVFNPVAGTGQLVERDLSKKDQVILWSPFCDVAKPIDVPDRLYLFAKDAQPQTKTATVEVARYTLGYWHSENFQVRLGEAIGKEVEPKVEKPSARTAGGRITGFRGGPGSPMMAPVPGGLGAQGGLGMPGMGDYMITGSSDKTPLPTRVDYSTGKVLVDLVPVSDLGGTSTLRPRTYHDMLYTADGTSIEHMPASMTNWPENLTQVYQYIQSEKRREPQAFRAFNKGGLRGRGRRGMTPGMYPGMEGGYNDMMMDMPGGPGSPYGPGGYP